MSNIVHVVVQTDVQGDLTVQTLQEVSGFIDVDRVHKDARPALMADLVSDEHSIIASAFGKSWTSLLLWGGRSLLFVTNSVSGSCVIDIHKNPALKMSLCLHRCTLFRLQSHALVQYLHSKGLNWL